MLRRLGLEPTGLVRKRMLSPRLDRPRPPHPRPPPAGEPIRITPTFSGCGFWEVGVMSLQISGTLFLGSFG